MWDWDHKESWKLKNWCFWTVVLAKILESPLDCKEIQPVHPKGNQSWIFIERTNAEAERQILWPPDAKNWLIWKDPDAGQDWRQEGKGTTEDDGSVVSRTQWTWVWASSRSWWWTGSPGVLQSMGLQSQIWLSNRTELIPSLFPFLLSRYWFKRWTRHSHFKYREAMWVKEAKCWITNYRKLSDQN